ncbi:hypothetical protein [Lonsdalea quercina]|uniref:hypothetical protein n=1 Tax=Lonsdalea quercina TaxID=71657 RepID=UPI003976DB82
MKNPAECRNRRSRWTLREMRYVENHYATRTAADIGVSPGRPASSVACTACKSGVTRRKAELWTEEEKAVIYVHYAAGMLMQDVMALLPGRTRGTILAKADKLGIKRPSRWSQKECDILKDYYPSEGQKAYEPGVEYQGGAYRQYVRRSTWIKCVLRKELQTRSIELKG